MSGIFYIVGTPIGNLKEITLRALEILKSVELIYCEDTRRSVKLLNAYEISKPLKSCPHFKELKAVDEIAQRLESGQSLAFISDAGMPGICDPGARLVAALREKKLKIEIVGGVSSLTSFLAGAGVDLEEFTFVGFLPARAKDREELFDEKRGSSILFFESPHRIETTLEILSAQRADSRLILGKELSKISEHFYDGQPAELKKQISSFKGEWVGLLLRGI